jgi:hypothetical protein
MSFIEHVGSVASATSVTVSSSNSSGTWPTTAGRLLVALITRSGGQGTGALTSVTDSAGNAWQIATRGAVSGLSNTRIEVWYAEQAASVTSITFNSATSQTYVWNILEFDNLTSFYGASPDYSFTTSSRQCVAPLLDNSGGLTLISAAHYPQQTGTLKTTGWTALTNFDDTTVGSGRAAYLETNDIITAPSHPTAAQMTGHTEPEVRLFGSTYYCYYRTSTDEIAVMTSTDGVAWTEQGTIVTKGTVGQWDVNYVISPSVVLVGGVYHLFYEGNGAASSAIGHATATNPLGPFTKDAANPIFVKTGTGFESTLVGTPAMIYQDGTWYLFYHGFNGTNDQTALAWSTNLTSWTRHPNNPILPVSGWHAQKNAPSSAIVSGDEVLVAIEGEPGTGKWAIGIAAVPISKLKTNQLSLDVGSLSGPMYQKSTGNWDDDYVQLPSLIADPVNANTYWLYYSGHNIAGNSFSLGRTSVYKSKFGAAWELGAATQAGVVTVAFRQLTPSVPDTSFSGFDGIDYPALSLSISTGGNLNPSGTTLVLGVGPTLATATLGGGGWSEIGDDLRFISRSFGRSADGDSAQIGTCTFTVDNESGDYDSSNPNGAYWGANLLTSQQYSLEANNTNGWVVVSNISIASSTTVGGYHGLRALQLTKLGSTGTSTAKTTKIPFPEQVACRISAWFKAGTVARDCKMTALFYDENGVYISGADIASSLVTDNTTGWTQVTISGVSPVLAASVEVQVQAFSVPLNENHYVDAVMLQQSGIEIGMPVRWNTIFNGVTYPRFYGKVTSIRMNLGLEPEVTFECNDGMETLGRARLDKSVPQFDLDATGARINNLADEALWPTSLRSIDEGYTTLGPTDFGDSALQLMKLTEMTEYGLLFCDGSGKLVFYDRHRTTSAARSTIVQADFTTIELDALESERSTEQAFNVVHITRNPSIVQGEESEEPIEQTAIDVASRDRFGIVEFQGDVGRLLKQDEDAKLMAEGLLHRGKQPKTLISEVRIEAMTLGLWTTLLALTLLDRIKISRDYGPNTVTRELLIQGMSEQVNVNPPRWDINLNTSSPYSAPSLFVLGTSQLGSGKLGW